MSKARLLQAIRAKCIDCQARGRKLVRYCAIDDCSLWPYRMGKDPHKVRDAKNLTQTGGVCYEKT
jgi:hypothetical protein